MKFKKTFRNSIIIFAVITILGVLMGLFLRQNMGEFAPLSLVLGYTLGIGIVGGIIYYLLFRFYLKE